MSFWSGQPIRSELLPSLSSALSAAWLTSAFAPVAAASFFSAALLIASAASMSLAARATASRGHHGSVFIVFQFSIVRIVRHASLMSFSTGRTGGVSRRVTFRAAGARVSPGG